MFTRTIRRTATAAIVAGSGVVGLAGIAGADSPSVHVVQPGDTLWDIAGSNWPAVAEANGLANPDLILPGQVIRLDGAAPPAPATQAPIAQAPVALAPTAQAPVAPARAETGDTVWDRLAQCESSGNWHINTGNGFYGGLQFTQSSWNAAGGSGNPADASREEQIRVAENLLGIQGWGAWPACSAKLGLR